MLNKPTVFSRPFKRLAGEFYFLNLSIGPVHIFSQKVKFEMLMLPLYAHKTVLIAIFECICNELSKGNDVKPERIAVELGFGEQQSILVEQCIVILLERLWAMEVNVEKKMEVMMKMKVVLTSLQKNYVQEHHRLILLTDANGVVTAWTEEHCIPLEPKRELAELEDELIEQEGWAEDVDVPVEGSEIVENHVEPLSADKENSDGRKAVEEHRERSRQVKEETGEGDGASNMIIPEYKNIRKLDSTRSIEFTEDERLDMWNFLYKKLFDNHGSERKSAMIQAKGNIIWREYVEETGCLRSVQSLNSHFRRFMLNNIVDAYLPMVKMLRLIKQLPIPVTNEIRQRIESRFPVNLTVEDQILVDWSENGKPTVQDEDYVKSCKQESI